SQIVLRFLNRFPILVLLGGGLLGWIAAEIMVSDPFVQALLPYNEELQARIAQPLFAVMVMATGTVLSRRARGGWDDIVDLAPAAGWGWPACAGDAGATCSRGQLTPSSYTSNTGVALGGMTPAASGLPYPRSGGMTSVRWPWTFMPATPWSQPLITWPAPSRNSKGSLRSRELSNLVPW